jgi:amino acid adenylation domain-containing protein
MDAVKIIYNFKKNNSMLWVENDKLKLFISDDFKSQELKDTIVEFKSELFNLLVLNNVFSKDDFERKMIFKAREAEAVLSFAQERLWFIEQYEEGSNAFHIPDMYELTSATDIEGLKYALQQIVLRHEVLRSTIKQGDGQEHGIQQVNDEPLLIETIQLKDTTDYESLIKENINRPFNLSKEYPIRVTFYVIESSSKSSSTRTLLLINIHHIANDGWSRTIFINELFAFYEAYTNKDKSFSLPALEIHYKDYALWQKSYLTGKILEKQLSYWKDKLAGYEPLEFPIDYLRPSETDYKGAYEEFKINKEISRKLRALAQKNGVTLHSVMLTSLTILLNKYTGQNDIVIGSPMANRHHQQTEELIGFFVNTQVNRTLLNKNQKFEELIQQVHLDQIEAQFHQDLPFEMLVNELGVERDPSRHPVFQILFAVQNFGQADNDSGSNDYLMPFRLKDADDVEKLDLSIYIDDSRQEFLGSISYATSLFQKDTITRFIQHYLYLLEELIENSNKPYSQLSLLDSQEYNQIVYDWNATDRAYPNDETIIDLFEKQVSKTPQNIAVTFEEKTLTYRQLQEESNKLAAYLITNYNTQSNDLIGIMLDRSDRMIVAILAVLKAGAAYVCIDPGYPAERKKYSIQDASINVLITQADYLFDLEFYTGNLFAIDVQLDAIDGPIHLSKHTIKSDDLAYVIYTSGTTGAPKGVMVEHKGLVNLIRNQVNCFGVKSGDTAIQFASYVFDASVSEIFTIITTGATLSIVPNTIRQDAHLLSNYIEQHQINIATLPPAILSAIPYKKFSALKTIIVAGESCPSELMNKWSKGIKLINAYGPTEATVCATMHQYNEGDLNNNIGKPLENTRLYLLDPNQTPTPIGVIGELYLGGEGLAKGYLNRPELTAERFVANPFATKSDKIKGYTRLYKTGDLARWLPDGNIEYIGRNDDQVKVRGYRIEMGEIEQVMLQIVGIRQVCVLAKEKKTGTSSTKYLVGYYALEDNTAAFDQSIILRKLSQVLPEYMIPASLIQMEFFPLTVNGKLDKGALPDPDFKTTSAEYIAPTNEIEADICTIWQEVLGLDCVGITDDFFKIGGNSILAIQISHRMSKVLGSDVKVADVFKFKVINILLENSKVLEVDFENMEKEY